jgi:hypothetical protein
MASPTPYIDLSPPSSSTSTPEQSLSPPISKPPPTPSHLLFTPEDEELLFSVMNTNIPIENGNYWFPTTNETALPALDSILSPTNNHIFLSHLPSTHQHNTTCHMTTHTLHARHTPHTAPHTTPHHTTPHTTHHTTPHTPHHHTITPHQHVNTATRRHIDTSTHRHIDTSTHRHNNPLHHTPPFITLIHKTSGNSSVALERKRAYVFKIILLYIHYFFSIIVNKRKTIIIKIY